MMPNRAGSVSPAAKPIALAGVAVLLPITLLSVLEYRSLLELQDKTKTAVQENLRQTLEAVVRRVETRLRSIAADSLLPLTARNLRSDAMEQTAQQFAAIRGLHPEIDQLFLLSRCTCRGQPFAIVSAPAGARRMECSQFDETVARATSAFQISHPLPGAATAGEEFRFFSGSCPTCALPKQLPSLYLFRALPGEDLGPEQVSFAALTLKLDHIARHILPEATADLRRGAGSESPGDALVVAVFEDGQREVYASGARPARYEVRAGFGPLFPMWELAAGYRTTTIEALARQQFRNNLLLTALVLGCLLAGILLMLRAAAREARLAELKSAFVSNVSHEMKTPLALIRLFAETLELGRVKSAERLQEYYRVIHNESRRLSQLIDNILDFSKMEAGRKQYHFEPGDVAEVVDSVVRTYEYQIRNAGFELSLEVDHCLPPLCMDAGALSQAVLNLLNNAVKYSAEVKKVGVRVARRDSHVAIEVADCGIGIPRSEHEKIFEKFYRVSTGLVHNTKGSGLGLTLSKHIVEAHRGRILVDSQPGAGSRFTILLPIETLPQNEPRFQGVPVAQSADRRG
jgi:signal transduction histidine kinase